MSVNSLESLLARMRQGSVTQGWGAVSVFSRSRVNRLLEQQYIERFNGHSFLPPFSGRIAPSEGSYELVELKNIGLGQPLLSFNSASLTNPTAILTMNIIAGSYITSRPIPGAQPTLLSALNITEQHGFKLEMDIDLSLVVGEVDKRGRVKLDLSQGVNFRCNLAGDDELANARLASYFKQRFEELPEHRSVFQLGMLDLKGYNALTPKSFRILTQAAPGAKVRGALNYGDGGVVVLIRLLVNTSDGRFPPDASITYLIPDDKEADGSDRYSATLILSEAMAEYVEDDQLDVLNNLLFPGENIFEERDREKPRDLAVFGNINPRQTRIYLDPAFTTLKAGDKQQFTLRDWQGKVIQASKWKDPVSLQSHTQEGHGTIVNGVYSAPSQAQIGHDSLHVVVTADYISAGVMYSASALLLVAFDDMTVAPRVATFAGRTQTQSIILTASTAGAAPVTWSLLTPEFGALVQSDNQARFTPDARARTKGLVVQGVEASGAEKRQSSLVLVNAQQQLKIDPPYIPALKHADNVQLKDDASLLPGVPRRWKVISGGGTVDGQGLFTAPAQVVTSSSVVQCEIVRNGVVMSSGYSVVELTELEPEPGWKSLAQFTVSVPGGQNNGRLGSLDPNGYQQLRTQITVETYPEDGVGYPLSVIEKASMRLVGESKDEMEFVDDALEGIPEGDDEVWRARLITNRFDLAFPRMTGQDDSVSAEPAISRQDIYVHTRERAGTTQTFHAKFQADSDQKWWRSTDLTDIRATIEVTANAITDFIHEDYAFERVRVDGGSGGPGTPGQPDDDFDFHLRTVDYWTLRFKGRPGGLVQGAMFETLEFLPVKGKEINTSTIRWESKALWETMFSWTGYIFQETKVLDKHVNFDADVKNVAPYQPLNVDIISEQYEKGTLVISLHRTDTVNYVKVGNKSRDKLSRDLAVALIDKRGNVHKRKIAFLVSSVPGNRNYLEHKLFTPEPDADI
jgi:hypothetical protein